MGHGVPTKRTTTALACFCSSSAQVLPAVSLRWKLLIFLGARLSACANRRPVRANRVRQVSVDRIMAPGWRGSVVRRGNGYYTADRFRGFRPIERASLPCQRGEEAPPPPR